MAKATIIHSGIVRDGVAYEGDIVATYEDDVELSGIGYPTGSVLHFPALTKSELDAIFSEKYPTLLPLNDGTRGVRYEQEPDVWIELKYPPKYKMNISDMSELERGVCASLSTDKETVIAILNNKAVCCVEKQLDDLKPISIEKSK